MKFTLIKVVTHLCKIGIDSLTLSSIDLDFDHEQVPWTQTIFVSFHNSRWMGDLILMHGQYSSWCVLVLQVWLFPTLMSFKSLNAHEYLESFLVHGWEMLMNDQYLIWNIHLWPILADPNFQRREQGKNNLLHELMNGSTFV